MTLPVYEPDRYEGNGATTVYPYNFKVFSEEHIVATVEDTDGNVETLTLGEEADYTVQDVGEAAGTITLAEALAADYTLVIQRVVPMTQTSAFAGLRAFHGKSHDDIHDKLMMICQQLALQIMSSIQLSPTEDPEDYSLLIPTLENRAGKVLAFDDEGNLTAIAALPESDVAISGFGESLIEAADQASALTVLGWSAFMQTLKAAANAAALKTLLGMTAFGQALTDDADASAGLTTLGFSAFVKTLVDAANEEDFRALIGLDGEEGSVGTGDLEDEAVTSDKLASAVIAQLCQGRLTLTTATPVTTTDVTAAGTLYFTPFRGNKIALYHDARWNLYAFTEKNYLLSDFGGGAGVVADKPYDVFMYSNAGTPTLELLAWTNGTTRATALAYQDGVLVKTGDATRRYLGTVYTSGVNTVEDSRAKRFVWNYYNRVRRTMIVTETTNSWTYDGGASIRIARASASNKLQFIVGVAEDEVTARVVVAADLSDEVGAVVGIGLDSVSAFAAGSLFSPGKITSTAAVIEMALGASLTTYGLAVGYHYLAWLENVDNETATFYGDTPASLAGQSGIQGEIWA